MMEHRIHKPAAIVVLHKSYTCDWFLVFRIGSVSKWIDRCELLKLNVEFFLVFLKLKWEQDITNNKFFYWF